MALQYENKVPSSYRKAFIQKVKEVSQSLGINPNWLMAIMYFESAGTFSPSIQSPATNATGLIQFMPATAKGLGTSIEALKKMSAVDQLDYVYKYFSPYTNKIKKYTDTYFAVFFPLAIGKPDSFILETASLPASLIAKQNPAFDTNKDGKIYVSEVKAAMLKKLPVEFLNEGELNLFYNTYKKTIWTGAAAAVIGISSLIYYAKKSRN